MRSVFWGVAGLVAGICLMLLIDRDEGTRPATGTKQETPSAERSEQPSPQNVPAVLPTQPDDRGPKPSRDVPVPFEAGPTPDVGGPVAPPTPLTSLREEGDFLRVRVEDPAGEPILSGLRFSAVRAETASVNGYPEPGGELISNASAKVVDGVHHLSYSSVLREAVWGDWVLRAEHEELGPVAARISNIVSEVQVLRYQEAGKCTLRVLGANRWPAGGSVMVGLRPVGALQEKFGTRGLPGWSRWLATGPEAEPLVFEIPALPQGEYEALVHVLQEGSVPSEDSSWALTLRRFSVVPGQSEITVSLPPLGSLFVEAPDLKGGARAQLEVAAGAEGLEFKARGSWHNGGFDFGALPDGDYLVRTPSGAQRVRVSGTTRVTLAPMIPKRLALRVTSADGAFAAAGFEDGDEVLSISGHEDLAPFSSADQLLVTLVGQAKTTVSVRRGGAERTLEVEGPDLMKRLQSARAGVGGKLTPVFE